MSILNQVNDFIFFIILGIVISCIFDIFRSLRKIKKRNSIYVVMIQDIIFFIIITIVSILYIITILDDNIRFYMFAAIIIGIALSRKIISKYLIKFYSIVFYGIKNFILFLCVPLELNYYIICNIMKKISKKCCKMFSFMITLKCKLLSNLKSNNFKKRGLKNEKKSGSHKKRKGKKEKKIA